MALTEKQKETFSKVLHAVDRGGLALVECTVRATKQPVAVLCSIRHNEETYIIVPLAQLFDGDPFELLEPPLGGTLEEKAAITDDVVKEVVRTTETEMLVSEDDPGVDALRRALLAPGVSLYEGCRRSIIDERGYEVFFALQHLAFQKILGVGVFASTSEENKL